MKSGYIIETVTGEVVGVWSIFGNVLRVSPNPQSRLRNLVRDLNTKGVPIMESFRNMEDSEEVIFQQTTTKPLTNVDTLELSRFLGPEGFSVVPKEDVEKRASSEVRDFSQTLKQSARPWTENQGYIVGPGDITVGVWRFYAGQGVVVEITLNSEIDNIVRQLKAEGIPSFEEGLGEGEKETFARKELQVTRKPWNESSPLEVGDAMLEHGYFLVPSSEVELKPTVWRK